MKYVGVLLADLHFGAVSIDKFKNELKVDILNRLNNMERIDYIIILGDYWDKKLPLNSEYSELGVWFMNKLCDVCKKIRIVYGTQSHEENQYSVFSIFENRADLDFRIIKTVCDEELFKDVNVLYIPEEYIKNKDDYYNEYFSNKKFYNYIFGHGIISEVMTMSKKHTKDSTSLKPPVFTTADFKKCIKGEVYFGHYHIHTKIQDNMYYVGSFSRWIHGEEESKGYYVVTYDSLNDNYKNEFIENYDAPLYKTYIFGYDSEIFTGKIELEQWIQTLKNLANLKDNQNVRYIINIPDDYENPEFLISTLKESFRHIENVKFDFVNGYIEKKKEASKKALNEIIDKYSYFLDKNISTSECLNKFIKDKYNVELGGKNIELYLNTSINTLIENELNG